MTREIPTIRLVGLDLDGTTFNHQKIITPRVRDAIQRGIEAGIDILPATGRQLSGVPRAFLDIPGVRYALCSNGAKVYDLAKDGVVYEHCFTVEKALSILEASSQYPNLASVFIDGESYTDRENFSNMEDFVAPELWEYYRSSRHIVDNLAAVVREKGQPVEKFALNFNDLTVRQQAWGSFASRGDVEVTSSVPGNIELNTKGSDKGRGMLALGRHLGIPKEEIMAVGDSSNDLQMLKSVGYGVAMGNASPDVLAVANWVTAGCEDDGVAVAIERILKGRQK